MLGLINKYIFGAGVPVLLITVGIFYSFYLGFFHICKLGKIIKELKKPSRSDGISPFRALTLALAGTLGVGNIVGVAAAIALGGFGSIFWMWVSALCAMLLKYAEIVLAVRHRRSDEKGNLHGSAMLYIRDFFTSRSHSFLGGAVAAVFAVLCIVNAIAMGGMIQSNAISDASRGIFGADTLTVGIILAPLSAAIISRGTDGISKFTEILVPIMSAGYVIISLAVIIIERASLPSVFARIFTDALSLDSAAGGIFGFLFSRSLRFGTMRGLISNEAGCGTAPMAHAASHNESAAAQGFWGIVEVFVDTILLCTMTALVIMVNIEHLNTDSDWIMLTLDAYSQTLGSWAGTFLAVAVFCFGFATIVCWAHYGIECVYYFSRKRHARTVFVFVYCISVFLGSITATDAIWDIADVAIGTMTLINLVLLFLMRREVKEETLNYFGSADIKRRWNV